MSTLYVNTITDAAGTGAVNVTGAVAVGGTPLASVNTMDFYSQGTTPTSPKDGALWYDTSTSAFKMYTGAAWISLDFTLIPPAIYGDTAVFTNGGSPNNMAYLTISTTSNAATGGTLTVPRTQGNGVSNGPLGVFGGGQDGGTPGYTTLDAVVFSTLGNAVAWGSFPATLVKSAPLSNGVNGLWCNGMASNLNQSQGTNICYYIAIATGGVAASFGTSSYQFATAGASSSIVDRGLVAGGSSYGSYTTAIRYFTLSTPGNSVSFGNLTVGRDQLAGLSDNNTAVFGGGYTGSNSSVIDYVNIAAGSTATSFGSLTVARNQLTSASNGTRGVFVGGGSSNTVDYITIATPGNAVDFGDLPLAANWPGGVSGD